MRKATLFVALGLLVALPVLAANRQPKRYEVRFEALNGSGVTGTAKLDLDGRKLEVDIQAEGLTPGEAHPEHIHGFPGAVRSTCPSTGHEAEAAVEQLTGPPDLFLEPFNKVGADGDLSFSQTFTIARDRLMPLKDRAIVLHGMMVNGKYDASLPVACGEIREVRGS